MQKGRCTISNLEHSTLTTTNLHENKGVSTATDNTVATAVSGATVWAKLTASNLTGTGNSFGAQLFNVCEQQSSGTGAASFVSGAWRTRVLNTTKTNEIAGASLASNQFTLPTGTYYIIARAQAGILHKIKLRNITDGSTTIVGSPSGATATSVNTDSWLSGRFTISGSKVFEIQDWCNTNSRFGDAVGGSEVEVYAEVMIWKLS